MGDVTVEMESRSAGPDGVFRPGDTRECSKSKAKALVESGQARYIDEDEQDDTEEEAPSEEEESEESEESDSEGDEDGSGDEQDDTEEQPGVDKLMEDGRVERNGPYYILLDEDGEEVDSFHGRDALEEHLNE